MPVCPKCGSPGFQYDAKQWFGQAEEYEESGNKRYIEFLEWFKETCTKMNTLSAYEKWLKEREET